MRLSNPNAIACLAFAVGCATGALVHRSDTYAHIRSAIWARPDSAMPISQHYAHKVSILREFPPAGNIIMIGDSITEMGPWGAAFPEAKIANYGIGWDTTEGMLARIDSIISSKAKAAFVMIGTNDFMMGADADTVFGRYVKIIDEVRSIAPVYVQSTILAGSKMNDRNDKISDLNQKLKAKCLPDVCTYVDINAILAPEGYLRADCSVDGIHLNGKCYRDWANAIRPFISRHTT